MWATLKFPCSFARILTHASHTPYIKTIYAPVSLKRMRRISFVIFFSKRKCYLVDCCFPFAWRGGKVAHDPPPVVLGGGSSHAGTMLAGMETVYIKGRLVIGKRILFLRVNDAQKESAPIICLLFWISFPRLYKSTNTIWYFLKYQIESACMPITC